MVRLFIVDDEKILREGLCRINWESIGVTCVGSAENGLDALEKIKELRPDIVISDIKMPVADGLFLAKKLQNIMQSIKIVFLSGFDEFEYAQKAITYNVCEYLLKPIQPKELLSVIEKIKIDIEIQKKEDSKKEDFKKYIHESKHFLKEWMFTTFKMSSDEEKLYEKLKFFGIDLNKGSFMCCVVNILDTNENIDSELLDMFKGLDKILEMSEMKFASFFDGSIFTYVFSFDHVDEKNAYNSTYVLCEEFKEYLELNFKGTYNIGIGNMTTDIREIQLSADSAISACKYSKYFGENQIIFINDMEPETRTARYKTLMDTDYTTAIKVGHEEDLTTALNAIFKEIKLLNGDLYTFKRICLELVVCSSRVLYELGQKPELLFKNTDIWSVINGYDTEAKLYDFILNINKVVIYQVNYNKNISNKKDVDRAKKIIDEQFATGIGLESVAEQIFISPCYLSNIFSRECGVSFKQYLIQTRINKAKEMLMDGKLKVYEVAEGVGYNDFKHFRDTFKKYTGQTPNEYRKTIVG